MRIQLVQAWCLAVLVPLSFLVNEARTSSKPAHPTNRNTALVGITAQGNLKSIDNGIQYDVDDFSSCTQHLVADFLQFALGEGTDHGRLRDLRLEKREVFLKLLRQLFIAVTPSHSGPANATQAKVESGTTATRDERVDADRAVREATALSVQVLMEFAAAHECPVQPAITGMATLADNKVLVLELVGHNASLVERLHGVVYFLRTIRRYAATKLQSPNTETSDSANGVHEQVLIVGGGPSGLVSAVQALLENPLANVSVLEKRTKYTRHIWFDLYAQVVTIVSESSVWAWIVDRVQFLRRCMWPVGVTCGCVAMSKRDGID